MTQITENKSTWPEEDRTIILKKVNCKQDDVPLVCKREGDFIYSFQFGIPWPMKLITIGGYLWKYENE